MSVQVKLRRDTATRIAAFTPAQGEVVVDTTNNRIVVGDGATAGGTPLAKLSEIGAALGSHGSALALNVAEIALTGLSGATVTASGAIPAGVTVFACAVLVTATIAGATSFSVGYGGGSPSSTAFGSGLGVASGSSNKGLIGPNPFYSSTDLTITASGGSFTAGAVRLALMYLSITPPTI